MEEHFIEELHHRLHLNSAALTDQEDVIIVTFKQVNLLSFKHTTGPHGSYRLSVLGFPGNPSAQNNVAFLDQRLAME